MVLVRRTAADDVEKEALHRLHWKMAEFSGVRLVTDCIMGNPFHALVEVPRREIWLQRFSGEGGEERLFEHLRTLYSKEFVGLLRQELEELRRLGMDALALARLEAIQKRFCDLSIYVKEVKECFSRWFNKRRGRKGTLWMDRYKSVMVEGKGEPLHTMAAHIDLNPGRAGLVEEPKAYRCLLFSTGVEVLGRLPDVPGDLVQPETRPRSQPRFKKKTSAGGWVGCRAPRDTSPRCGGQP